MRKQELLHVHQLLALTREELSVREPVPGDPFAAYDDLGVSPFAFDRAKEDHEAAIARLVAGFERLFDALDATREDLEPPAP